MVLPGLVTSDPPLWTVKFGAFSTLSIWVVVVFNFAKAQTRELWPWGVGAGEAAHLASRLKFDLVLCKGTLKKRLDPLLWGAVSHRR